MAVLARGRRSGARSARCPAPRRIGLPIGDLRLAHVGGHLELARHAVHEHVEVQLAHARDERLAGLLVVLDAERGVLLGQALEGHAPACPGRPSSCGSMATSMTGSGKVIDSRMTGWSGSVSVSPGVRLAQAHRGGDVAGGDLVDLLAMVGVQLDDAPDALLAVLRGVEDVGAGTSACRCRRGRRPACPRRDRPRS